MNVFNEKLDFANIGMDKNRLTFLSVIYVNEI